MKPGSLQALAASPLLPLKPTEDRGREEEGEGGANRPSFGKASVFPQFVTRRTAHPSQLHSELPLMPRLNSYITSQLCRRLFLDVMSEPAMTHISLCTPRVQVL